MADFEMKVTGLKEAIERMDTFVSPKVQQALLQNSLVEAMKPAKADAKRRLGKGAGYIVSKKLKTTRSAARTGIGISAKHWQLIFREYGTIERVTKKGARRGRIVAKPFIRPSCDSNVTTSTNKVLDYLAVETDRIFEGKKKAISLLKDADEVK